MTPGQFISKWKAVELKESTAAQSHFNDLCRLLDVEDPATADPKGEWFTFEKGASKTTGGEGWADVWRRNCFAWEYKGKNKDLNKAFAQLQQYAVALENPPLLVVSDISRIRLHTNWTNTVQRVHEFELDDLIDAGKRDQLRAAFIDPDKLKPAKTRQVLTEEAAAQFVSLTQRLRQRGSEAAEVAHFVNRLVFCMFAEDAGLLNDTIFERMLNHCATKPEEFETLARTLFGAMKAGGMVGFERIAWFNGGLFDSDNALPLNRQDIADLKAAARLDWADIDPSILGTLFERGLDPDKRSQLGAHYTDRDKIMQIITPVITEPLLAEWAEQRGRIEDVLARAPAQTKDKLLRGAELGQRTKAENEAKALHMGFLDRLAAFRVLDPACGSGNFLYLALKALKDIEHRVNLEAEMLGLHRELPRIGPQNVMGIELNPYAAELARVSVWIGEIQWMRRNGFDAAQNPILRSLNTIENRDAVLNADGTQAEWPRADVVVGNPPFLGNKKMIGELGEDYTLALRKAFPDVPGGVDLVCYWFAKAWRQMEAGQLHRAGLVATNSIRGGSNREVLKPIVAHGRIFNARSDEEWTVDGAAVRVSLVCFSQRLATTPMLNGKMSEKIHADLTSATSSIDLTKVRKLDGNGSYSFVGVILNGEFEVEAEIAHRWLLCPVNVNGRPNSDVIKRTLNGSDFLRGRSYKWVIDFGSDMSEAEAAAYEAPFEYVRQTVRPFRQRRNPDGTFSVRRQNHREIWWRYAESRPGMRAFLEPLAKFIVTPMVSSTRVFAFLDRAFLPNQKLVVIPRDDFATLGVLSSQIHRIWTLATCAWIGVGNDVTYSPTMTFETFPFPEGLTPDIPAALYADDPRARKIAAAAARLNELCENWLNPSDLVRREPEVVAGYPDRLLPVDEAAAKLLAKRTLTNLYNARPAWLDHAHRALDEAVADAYGWGDDWRAGTLTDDAILARLFALNQARA
jgi:type II restriction/modification system DNA methylase subunit YeeA